MRSLMPCILVIFFLFFRTSFSASPTIENTCRKTANGFVDYKFCVGAFEADPSSGSADVPGLAAIAVKLSIANATSTKNKITKLLKKESDPTTKNSLEACNLLYGNAISALEQSADFIASKKFSAAEAGINVALTAGPDCLATAAPLPKENGNFSKLTLLSTAIVKSLA